MQCKKCGCKEIVVKQANTQTGAYCAKCGAWIKWLRGSEINETYKTCFENPENRQKVSRVFIKKKGVTTIKCSSCRCQLYNSNAPEPIGQFNLLLAKFCPQCGAELI